MELPAGGVVAEIGSARGVGRANAVDAGHRIPGFLPGVAVSRLQGECIVVGGGDAALHFDIGAGIVGVVLGVDGVGPAKAEAFEAGSHVGRKDAYHAFIGRGVVDGGPVGAGLGAGKKAQPLLPVAQAAEVLSLVNGPV